GASTYNLEARARGVVSDALGSELVEHSGIGLHQADQILRLKNTEGAGVGARLGKALKLIGPRVGRVQQYRLGMPGMAVNRARRRVVARDGEDLSVLPGLDRQCRSELLNRLLHRRNVSVVAVLVGIFVID